MKRILTVAAHPDDEILGCGATMARHAAAGDDVCIAILGEGATSRLGKREDAERAVLESLKFDARRAAAAVGAQEVRFLDFPDNRFDTVPLLEVVKVVEALIAEFRPDIIYTHHAGDLNVDHEITHRAVLTATRPKPGQAVKEVLAFEVPSATDWSFKGEGGFHPNVFMDVGATLAAKLRALAEYRTEMCEFPHSRSLKAVEAAAVRWGSVAGCPAAEAFQLIRGLR